MNEYKDILHIDEYKDAVQTSQEKPVLLFKHSPVCPISSYALQEFEAFLKTNDVDSTILRVDVIRQRPVSREIAELSGIKHESPQLLLLSGGKVVWHESHGDITKGKIEQKLAAV